MLSPSPHTVPEKFAALDGACQRAQLRALLGRAVPDDPSLVAFCLDYFPDVAERFAGAMDRTTKLNLLLSAYAVEEITVALHHYEAERAARQRMYLDDTRILNFYNVEEITLPRKKVAPRPSKKLWKKLKSFIFAAVIFDYLKKFLNYLVRLFDGTPKVAICSILVLGSAIAGTSTFAYYEIKNNQRLDGYKSPGLSLPELSEKLTVLADKFFTSLSHTADDRYRTKRSSARQTLPAKRKAATARTAKIFVPQGLQIQKISGDCKLNHILITSGRNVYYCAAGDFRCLRVNISGNSQFEASAIWLAGRGQISYSNTSALQRDRKNGQVTGDIYAPRDPKCRVSFVVREK